MAPGPPHAEVFPWLKTLPLAPEYHPTLAEFQDPIAYILKIEKEASLFGICKIVPPLPAAPKKTAVANLNRSFAARSPTKTPTFTTRQQQIGFCPRRPRPVQKPVWQSGERYTLPQFEAKARQFERTHLRKTGKNGLSPLGIETLFWKACADKPFSVEYANDMPGSGFAPLEAGKRRPGEETGNVAESAWNMRGVSRGKASLLRFMKEEIPGVTSPMVYVAMMFSWFAWHVEDHDLHSMNYLHTGDGKTWYGVPRDAALAFEEVVRVHGYNGEVNPLVTFAILGEKTTVMSPEVLIGAGIPCCRLVQNAGEFVVTFPGAYHLGFSHGFNCAEAANIATPEWLKVAKEAAVRRASTNYPPMLSHFQLLYALALSFCSRMPKSSGTEPRSSRLKYKMRGEGEVMVKAIFVENVMHNNGLLSILLDKGSCCIVLPQYTSDSPLYSGLQARSQIKVKPRLSLGLCSLQEAVEATEFFSPGDAMQERNMGGRHLSGVCPTKGDFFASDLENVDGDKETTLHGGGLLDEGLLSCVMCGILTFACVAVIQPREAAARYLMSADCSFFNDETVDSTETSDLSTVSNWKTHNSYLVSGSGKRYNNVHDRLDHNSAHCSTQSVKSSDQHVNPASAATQKGISALDLLASAYADSSESEEEAFHEMSACTDETDLREFSLPSYLNENLRFGLSSQNLCSNKIPFEETELHLVGTDYLSAATGVSIYPKNLLFRSAMPAEKSCLSDVAPYRRGLTIVNTEEKCQLTMEFLAGNRSENPEIVVTNNLECDRKMSRSSSLTNSMEVRHSTDGSCMELDSRCHNTEIANFSHNDIKMENSGSDSANFYISPDSCRDTAPTGNAAIKVQQSCFDTSTKNSSLSAIQRSDKDSSRMHVFCLEHAVEVEKQLRPVGGGHIMLLCRPDFPKIEAEARFLADELGFDHLWKDIPYREATEEVREWIRSALEDEEAATMNSDWAVKMGINLYYSANLSKSPLYSKQMPYNAVIYKAFGCNSPVSSPTKPKGPWRRPGRQKKISVAGKWCGKVWMSNQVHPHLAHRLHDDNNQEPVDETDTEDADQVMPPKKNSSCNNVAATRKSRKKRNMPLRRSSTKRPKLAIGVAEDSSVQGGRVHHDGLSKHSATPGCNGISNQLKLNPEAEDGGEGGPSTRLRRRKSKSEVQPSLGRQITDKEAQDTDYVARDEEQIGSKKSKKAVPGRNYIARDEEAEYPCDVERCTMSFGTKQDLALHRRNICPFKGCGKKFFSHKYLLQHRKVHSDERPIKCPWKGCKMTFKWSWARTEHVRVHTGARPYVCREVGCGKTFRFVSDFSRHKRKTGHPTKKGRR